MAKLAEEMERVCNIARARGDHAIAKALEPRPCKHCGNCCHCLIIGLCDEDLEREPRLREVAVPASELKSSTSTLKASEKYYIRHKKEKESPCVFLNKRYGNYFCSIYSSRPNTCRNFTTSLYTCKLAALELVGMDTVRFLLQCQAQGRTLPWIVEKIMSVDLKRVKQQNDAGAPFMIV
ncbi:YkgJ family cysteine cluster protein [Planctomycetota bacterium]